MASNIKEMRLASMLAWGSMAVTLIITDRVSTEPANLGKMLLLSALGLGVLPLIYSNLRNLFEANKQIIVFGVLFISVSFASILISNNPFERGFYGAFGRNTGFLSYFMLFILLLAATALRNAQSFEKILKALFIAGFLNIVYCLFASTGNDIFTWKNPTTAVLGTFGNPNFIGAFMGIFAGLISVQIVRHLKNKRFLLSLTVILGLTIYVIYLSDALQGILVAGFGIAATLYFLIRSKERISKLSSVFLGAAISFGVVGLFGILNIGPLARFLYKASITFRGEYWSAGLNMGMNNPFLGVGIDSYGLFYRTYRDESAVALPGVDITTDTAHNVVIDIFSGTGVLGALCYIAIVMIVLKTALSYIRKRKEFDPVFLSLFIPWLGYQLQSLISINQLGLAIWGWLLSGAVIGYVHSRSTTEDLKISEVANTKKSKKISDSEQLLPAGTALAVFASVVIGVLVALPPFLADAKSRNLMSGKGDSTAVINLAKEFPVDTIRINRSIVGLANSGLNVLAVDLAKYGTEKFPNDYASWYSLYELSGPGSPESEAYRVKLNEIDPFNPRFFAK
jgi:O-antigen ligase